ASPVPVWTVVGGRAARGAVVLGGAVLWGAGCAGAGGRRHGMQTLGAPMLLGQTAARQVLLHATAPAVLMGTIAALGGGGGLLLAGGTLELSGVALPVLLALVLVAARARDAAKGPMPLSLMT